MLDVIGVLAFLLLLAGIIFLPAMDQNRREREMMERMQALRDADEVQALLVAETHEVRGEAESINNLNRHHRL